MKISTQYRIERLKREKEMAGRKLRYVMVKMNYWQNKQRIESNGLLRKKYRGKRDFFATEAGRLHGEVQQIILRISKLERN